MGFVHLFSKWFFDYVRQIIYHGFLFVLILFLFCNINIYPSQNPKNMNYFKKICILVWILMDHVTHENRKQLLILIYFSIG